MAFVAALLGHTIDARADCAPFPNVTDGEPLTHERLISIVDSYYQGDWERAVWDWLERLDKLESAVLSGSAVTSRDRGLLQGKALERHVVAVHQGLDIVKCLRDEIRIAESLNNMDTAAGQ